MFGKTFCRTCGIPVHNSVQPIAKEMLNEMPEEKRAFMEDVMTKKAINLRLINGVDVKDLNVEHYDGYNLIKPGYVEP